MKVVVTGASGKAGRAVVRGLLERDHDVLSVDLVPPQEPLSPFLLVDLAELGQTVESLAGAGAVVWASSETILGLPFEREQPAYAPIDESHPPYPESSYAVSKLLSEELARQLNRWTGTPFVALRFSNIMEPEEYGRFPSFWDDARLRRWNLWGYVDARDVAQSCALALRRDVDGAEHFIIAAADTVMNRPSRELMAEVYPEVPYRPTAGEYDSLLSSEKARTMLGYSPGHSWRDQLES